MTLPLGWHLVAVVELVHLNDPESFAGRDFGPWQI